MLRAGHLSVHRRAHRQRAHGDAPGLWPLWRGERAAGVRLAGLRHSRPAGVRAAVEPLRRQPRLGGGLGGRDLALSRGLRAGAGAGFRLVHRRGLQGHAGAHPRLRAAARGGAGGEPPGRGLGDQPHRRLRAHPAAHRLRAGGRRAEGRREGGLRALQYGGALSHLRKDHRHGRPGGPAHRAGHAAHLGDGRAAQPGGGGGRGAAAGPAAGLRPGAGLRRGQRGIRPAPAAGIPHAAFGL